MVVSLFRAQLATAPRRKSALRRLGLPKDPSLTTSCVVLYAADSNRTGIADESAMVAHLDASCSEERSAPDAVSISRPA